MAHQTPQKKQNLDFARTEDPNWEDRFSPRAYISPQRPRNCGPKVVYSAERKPEVEYHNHRIRSKKSDEIIQTIPRQTLKYEKNILIWKSKEKRNTFWPQNECGQHRKCNMTNIEKSFGGEDEVEKFRHNISELDQDAMFLFFQGWCWWPHRRPDTVLKYYDKNGELLQERKYRYPKTVKYRIALANGDLVLCADGFQYLLGWGRTKLFNWTAKVYKERESCNFFPEYSHKKHIKEEKLVSFVATFLEETCEIRRSHYVENLVKSGNLSLRSKTGETILHYTQIYRNMLKAKDPEAWNYMQYQIKFNKWKRRGKIGVEPMEVDEKKPVVSVRHFHRIMKEYLKIKIKEPVKDRCPICADINAQKSRSTDEDDIAFYETLLVWHLKQKRAVKSLLKTIESLVEPY